MAEGIMRALTALSSLKNACAVTIDAAVDLLEPVVAYVVGARRWVVVELPDSDLAFYRVAGRRTALFAKGSLLEDNQRRELSSRKSDEVELRLLAERVISTTLKIPAAGIDHLDQIIAHRLDRLTPWSRDKLLYGFASTKVAGPDGQIEVEFAATSTDIALASVRRLEGYGLAPSRMGCSSDPFETALSIDLFRGDKDAFRTRRRRRISATLVGVLAICAIVFFGTYSLVLMTSERSSDLDQELGATRRALLNGTGNTVARQMDVELIGAKTQSAAAFELVDRLARILPDNTFLDELDIQEASVRIAGTSTEAAGLIGRLEAEPNLSNAAFASAVARQADGRDRFEITATRLIENKKANP